jgi:hypothetical protein
MIRHSSINIIFHQHFTTLPAIKQFFLFALLILGFPVISSKQPAILRSNPGENPERLKETPETHEQSSIPALLDPLEKKMFLIDDSNPQNSTDHLDRVCIIGSGNWGSAIARIVGNNCERLPYFENQVNMWVFEELVHLEDGTQEKLTDVINTRHVNLKYLPGVRLPSNVLAVPDLAEACKGATLLIFVLPHQFLPTLLPIIRESAHPSCRGVSLIKGLGKSRTYAFRLLI